MRNKPAELLLRPSKFFFIKLQDLTEQKPFWIIYIHKGLDHEKEKLCQEFRGVPSRA